MTLRNRNLLTLAIVAMLALATSANAGTITVDTAGWAGSSGTYDASGFDKLVVIVAGEHGFNGTGNGSVTGVTYDGVEMMELVNRAPIKPVADPVVLADDTFNAIYYLDNPATSTGLIAATVASRGSMTVLGLTGTAPGAGNTVIGDRDTSSVDLTTAAGSIVIASYGMGGSGNTAFVNNVTPDAPLTLAGKQNNGGSRWWDGHVSAYANGVADGTATYSFTDTTTPGADGRTGAHVIAAEFTAVVPEPGSMMMLLSGLVGIALCVRRRR